MYQMFNFCPMLRLGKLTFLQMTGKIVLKPLRRKTKKRTPSNVIFTLFSNFTRLILFIQYFKS